MLTSLVSLGAFALRDFHGHCSPPPRCPAHSWQALSVSASSASVSLTSFRFGLCPIHVYFVVFSFLLLPAMATHVSGASLSLQATFPEPARVGCCSAVGQV